MTRTPYEVAEEALPGWTPVRKRERVSRAKSAEVGTPDLAELRRRYLGEDTAAGDDLAPASTIVDEDTEYVVMEREGAAGPQRRIVVVSRGRAVAVQG